MCKVYTEYHGTSEIEHGLCACTVDNPLATARGLPLRPGAQTMLYLSQGWSGGAMMLDKLPVLGRPANLDNIRARAYCAFSRCGWGLLGHFFLSSFISLFFLPLSGRRPDID